MVKQLQIHFKIVYIPLRRPLAGPAPTKRRINLALSSGVKGGSGADEPPAVAGERVLCGIEGEAPSMCARGPANGNFNMSRELN